MSTSNGINMLVALVRNKLLAVLLGPAGVGVFAQLFQVQSLVAEISPLGTQTGAIRYIAKYGSEKNPEFRPGQMLAAAFKMMLLLATLGVVVCLILVRNIAAWTLNDPARYALLIPAIVGVPFLLLSRVWLLYLQARIEVKLYAKATVASSLLGLLILIPLVLTLRLRGAAVHLLVFAVLSYLVAVRFAGLRLSPQDREDLRSCEMPWPLYRELLRYGFVSFVTAMAMFLTPLIVRSLIVHKIGESANGIYQAVAAISSQYMAIAYQSMVSYSLPKISQLKGADEVNTEVNNTVRAMLLFCTAGIGLILLTRTLVVPILFSEKFLPAVSLIPVQLIGDLFLAVGVALGQALLPREHFRARILIDVLRWGSFVALFVLLQNHSRFAAWAAGYGMKQVLAMRIPLYLPEAEMRGVVGVLMTAVVAYAIGQCLSMVAAYFAQRHYDGYALSAANKRTGLASLVAVGAMAFMPAYMWWYYPACVGIMALWATAVISKDEFRGFRDGIRRRLPGLAETH